MWLLDHNLPKQLAGSLKSLGIECDTAANRGWNDLGNGELLSAASRADFTCILTRDVLFAESASKAMDRFPRSSTIPVRPVSPTGRTSVRALLAVGKPKPEPQANEDGRAVTVTIPHLGNPAGVVF